MIKAMNFGIGVERVARGDHHEVDTRKSISYADGLTLSFE